MCILRSQTSRIVVFGSPQRKNCTVFAQRMNANNFQDIYHISICVESVSLGGDDFEEIVVIGGRHKRCCLSSQIL